MISKNIFEKVFSCVSHIFLVGFCRPKSREKKSFISGEAVLILEIGRTDWKTLRILAAFTHLWQMLPKKFKIENCFSSENPDF
jgi:hypothetical protein